MNLEPILNAIPQAMPSDHRYVIAIAGPPASGKTTTADALCAELDGRAALLQMDAFHYDDAILNERGHRSRKGAPHTFDVAGYRMYLKALRRNPSLEVAVPRFDRSLELSRNCAAVITAAHQIIITEGNYLLLDQDPWRDLRELYDLDVAIDTTLGVVHQRIVRRWIDHGLETDEATARAETNDLPNARLVIENSAIAQVNITTSDEI